LMLGAEMTLLDDWTLSLLQNEKLLRLENGNFLSRQVLRDREKCVWAAVDPTSGERYVALFNFCGQEETVSLPLSACGAMFPQGWFTGETGTWMEVWSGEQANFVDTIFGQVPSHGVLLFHKA